MEKQIERQCRANAVFTDEAYLKTRYICREDGTYTIRVGRGERRDVLACKELYGKAVKTALELDCTACAFDLSPASELGQNGLFAAAEGVCGGAYRKKFALSGRWEPELACSFPGADAEGEQVQKAWQLARSIMETRDLVNCPANLLRPEMLAQKLKDMADGLPIEADLYDRQALERLGLRGLLTVGDSSAYAPAMVVLRYTGAPDCGRRSGGCRSAAGAGGERRAGQCHGRRAGLREPDLRFEHGSGRCHHQLFRQNDRDSEFGRGGAADPRRRPCVGRRAGGLHASC